MKDLDFDELDRAVNSLMTNVPKSAPQPDESSEKTLDLSAGAQNAPLSQVPEANRPSAEPDTGARPAPVPAPRADPSPARTAPSMPAARRGGRFMDVVHPSSDMKKPEPAARPVSRQGATIEPTAPAAAQASAAQATSEEPSDTTITSPVMTSQSDSAPEPIKSPTPANEWPDPLDMPIPSASPKPQDDATEVESEPASMDTTPKTEAPLTSPFLPDAKVEKRPLGAVSPEAEETQAPAIEKDADSEITDEADSQLPAKPEDVEPQLPEELQGDLMAVEADTTHDKLKEAHESGSTKKAHAEEKPSPSMPATEPDTAPAASTGPTSIPQQYREEPSTSEQKNGAIYDTDTYHQPLQHPAKKGSSWLWIVWIVLILLLGAGGGAALYFLRLV